MIDYDDGTIKVRKSIKSDVKHIADNMRESDRAEIWASNHLLPFDAISTGLENSVFCRTIVNGHPIAMFGICPHSIVGVSANIWLLGTPDIDKIKTVFLRHCEEYVEVMLEYYGHLSNYVDVRNEKSIRWLKFLGAEFKDPEPFGPEGLMFQHFSFTKEK